MKKISTKLNIAMLSITVLTLAFVGGLLIFNMTVNYYREFDKASSTVLDKDFSKDSNEQVSTYLESKMPLFHECCDYYIFDNGNIVYSSTTGGLLNLSDNLASALAIENSDKADALDCTKTISDSSFIYILDTKEQLRDSILDITFLFLQAIVFAVILAAIISFFASKKLTRSIKELESGAILMSEGQFCEIPVKSSDEIGSLCTVFNEMGRQIQKDYDQFEKAENAQREFVANVSHEMKTPLTVIKSYSETLKNMDVDKQTANQFLSVIDSEADRMTDIVSQLLKLSGLETNAVLSKTDIELKFLCKQITDNLKFEADKKSVSFNINGQAKVHTDKEKLETILTNVISNAVKYCNELSEIEITITEKYVGVKNYGAGIEKDDLPHIFDRFYRTDPARNRETGGTGLGLAIAKQSADIIGANLIAKSIPDEYTEFILEF